MAKRGGGGEVAEVRDKSIGLHNPNAPHPRPDLRLGVFIARAQAPESVDAYVLLQ